jgi:hypothetical protein
MINAYRKQWINTKVEYQWSDELGELVEISKEGYWYEGEMTLCWTASSDTSPTFERRTDTDGSVEIRVSNYNTGSNARSCIAVNGEGGGGDAQISFNFGGGGSDWSVGSDNSDDDKFKIAGGTDSHSPALHTNTRLTIDRSGNVGIGTAVPVATLQVAGGSDYHNGIGTPAFSLRQSNNNAYGWDFHHDTGTDGDLHWHRVENNVSSMFMTIQRSSGKIGIGTTVPSQLLHLKTTGSADTTMVLEGSSSTWSIGTDYSDSGYLKISNNATAGTSTAMTFGASGKIGIGTAAPSYKLEVAGTFYSSGSSIEYKQDVEPYTPPEGALMGLKPVQYQYKDAWKDFGKRYSGNSSRQIGFVAEDVAKILPELAVTKSEDGKEVVRNVDYEKLTVLLVSEVQSLRKEVNDLRTNRQNHNRPETTNTKLASTTASSRRLQTSVNRHGKT